MTQDNENLRDRIASAIVNSHYNRRYQRIESWGAMKFADIIVEELGLRREGLGQDIGYEHPVYRWVTGWRAEDE